MVDFWRSLSAMATEKPCLWKEESCLNGEATQGHKKRHKKLLWHLLKVPAVPLENIQDGSFSPSDLTGFSLSFRLVFFWWSCAVAEVKHEITGWPEVVEVFLKHLLFLVKYMDNQKPQCSVMSGWDGLQGRERAVHWGTRTAAGSRCGWDFLTAVLFRYFSQILPERDAILSWKTWKKGENTGWSDGLIWSDPRHNPSKGGMQMQMKQYWDSLLLNNFSLWWSYSCPEQAKTQRILAKWSLYIILKGSKEHIFFYICHLVSLLS